MSHRKNLVNKPDQHQYNRFHQRQRYLDRKTERRRKTRFYDSSNSIAKTRSPARSWKQDELIMLLGLNDYPCRYDSDDDSVTYDFDSDPIFSNGKTGVDCDENELQIIPKYGIQQAIADANELVLDKLLKKRYLHSNYKEYATYVRRRRRTVEGHTLLTDAIVHGDALCIKVVLKNISDGYVYSTIIDHVCPNGRTALWYACSRGNLDLVQNLVEGHHANINKCGVLIVAAQNGHKNVIEYLLHKGCDPNRRVKNYNERALHAAVRRNHLDIVTLLLNYGADPNILDSKERTALDYAIHKRHLEIAKLLINHLNGHFIMSQTGFTPFMLATRRNYKPIIDLLSNRLSHQQVIDDLALLACNYMIYAIANRRNEAYSYFEQVLSRTSLLCNSTPCEAYEFQKECQTLDELAFIRDNENALRMHALLVSERILLERGEVKYLVSMIMKQSDVYKMHREFHRCLQLGLHACQLLIQTENTVRHYPQSYENILRKLNNALLKILREEDMIPFEKFVLVWTWAINKATNALSKVLFQFLCLATHLIESKSYDSSQRRIIIDLVRRTLHQNITMPNGYLFLSYCVRKLSSDIASDFDFLGTRIPVLSIFRLLLSCGANVNEIYPKTKSAPLHLLCHLSRLNTDDEIYLIKLLLDANAHLDCVDAAGRQPKDYTNHSETKEFLWSSEKPSLKCQCARLIIKRNICYKNSLSTSLINFVRMHGCE